MDLESDTNDPFATDDFWRASRFASAPLEPLPPILKAKDNLDLIRLDLEPFTKAFQQFPGIDQGLVELSGYEPLPLESFEPIEESPASSDSGAAHDELQYEDIWALGGDLTLARPSTKLLTWDSFLEPQVLAPCSAYLSEYGPTAFDAALTLRAELMEEKPGRNTNTNVYLRALFELGLGRDSIFFRFDNLTQTFLQDVEDISISGVSLPAMESIILDFVACGSSIRKLRSFVRDTLISHKCSPALFSLASAVSVIIYSLEAQLMTSMPSSPTLLQLSTLFQRSGAITKCLLDMVVSTKLTESNEELMSIVFKKCERLIWQHEWLTGLLNEVVLRVADPWLSFAEEWIGLQKPQGQPVGDDGQGKSFIAVESREIIHESGIKGVEIEYHLKAERVPSYVSPEHARTIFECGQSLRLLSELHPEHPVVASGNEEASPSPSLRWASSWVDLEALQARATNYEQNIRAAILEYNHGARQAPTKCSEVDELVQESTDDSDLFWWADENPQLCSLDSTEVLGKSLASGDGFASDTLYNLLKETEWCKTHSNPTNKTPFGPSFSLAPTFSLSPTLSAQARLIDFSCIHLLFTEYDLMSHLSIQRRYHLFGDGVFTSRLSQVLFDPEMGRADRKSGKVRGGFSTGLRLGSRETWPPAHSELRLVLMGLLNETYFPPNYKSEDVRNDELPGRLNFAVRELSEEEMEKCKDPNAVEALDFLRLQYKPPRALEAVITPICLYKYDRLFKFLLRMIRMLAVVRSLIRDVTDRSSQCRRVRNTAQKFRVDAHALISTLCDYSLTTAINQAWHSLDKRLKEVATCIQQGDIDGTIQHAKSLIQLREYHEEALDQMIFALFLTKKQAHVKHLLEDIFNTILAFAPLSRQPNGDDTAEDVDKKVAELHAKFRKQVGSFIQFLRGAEGKGLSRSQEAGGMGLQRLLLRLEMNRYYTR